MTTTMPGPAGDNPFDLDPDSRELWWLTQDDVGELVELLDAVADLRKALLFMCGCARLVLPRTDTPAARGVVAAAEAFADGEADAGALSAAAAAADHPPVEPGGGVAAAQVVADLGWAGEAVSGGYIGSLMSQMTYSTVAALAARPPGAREATVALIRCVFGNPFRPVAFDPDWRTGAAVAVARSMYEARDFAHAPILADALEDAGCTHPEVIGHLRGPGPHARGCWVVDGVLGRS